MKLCVFAIACLVGLPITACTHLCPASTARPTEAASTFSARVSGLSAAVVEISVARTASYLVQEPDAGSPSEHDYEDDRAASHRVALEGSSLLTRASGLIIAEEGLILTTAHALDQSIRVRVKLNDGRSFAAEIIGIDKRTDVGLLSIDAGDLPVVSIGDSSKLAAGDWVAAIGAPFGFRGSVTAGVVSATGRTLAGLPEVGFIQTDVAINPGSSGSPLFDANGKVVGVNSLVFSNHGGFIGLGFAVPIELAIGTVAQLRARGFVTRSRLGAEFQELTPALSRAFGATGVQGALLVKVDPGGPADIAGLMTGDIVTAFNGATYSDFAPFVRAISTSAPGISRSIRLLRYGRHLMAWATLLETTADKAADHRAGNANDDAGLGLKLAGSTADVLPAARRRPGLMVLRASGAAQFEGIRPGDSILAVNGRHLSRVAEFSRAVASARPGQTLALLVERNQRLSYVAVRVPRSRARSVSTLPGAFL